MCWICQLALRMVPAAGALALTCILQSSWKVLPMPWLAAAALFLGLANVLQEALLWGTARPGEGDFRCHVASFSRPRVLVDSCVSHSSLTFPTCSPLRLHIDSKRSPVVLVELPTYVQ